MLGLLAKAATLRKNLGLTAGERDEFAYDPDSGISREDQKEILQEIEKVATESRIAVSPEAFAVKAAKKGILFPVIVNAAAVFALVVGYFAFQLLFQRSETEAARESAAGITAAGKLIEELKKESEAQLQEKNAQINQIQGQLAQIDRERQSLQSTMDEKVRERETQLRAAVAAELDAERQKLRSQGLSDQDIARRLSELEARKNTEFTTELESYRRQADEERRKSEANLRALENEYTASLARANDERQKVLADSKKREEDLRAQLDQRTKELESDKAKAEAALRALASQKEKEDLATGQLVGMYTVAKSDIAAKDYAKALQSLQAIRDYVSREEVIALPAIARRREVDIFVVDSLTGLVKGEADKPETDTASLVAAAGLVADIRKKAADADALARAGNLEQAAQLYGEALAVIPEIERSYAFFADLEKQAVTGNEVRLRAGLARAEAAFEAGRYADCVAAYRDALAYLPEPPERLDRTLSSIQSAGAQLAGQKTAAEQSRAAAPLLAQATSLARQESWDESLAQHLAILAQYPQSAQAPQAVAGITEATRAITAQADATISARDNDLRGQLAAVQKDLETRSSEIAFVKQEIAAMVGGRIDPDAVDSEGLLAALRQKMDSLETAGQSAGGTAANLQRSLDQANATISSLRAEKTDLERQRAELLREKAELTARLAAAEQAARQPAPQGGQTTQGQQTGTTPTPQATVPQQVPGLSQEETRRLADLDRLVASYQGWASREDTALAREVRCCPDQDKAPARQLPLHGGDALPRASRPPGPGEDLRRGLRAGGQGERKDRRAAGGHRHRGRGLARGERDGQDRLLREEAGRVRVRPADAELPEDPAGAGEVGIPLRDPPGRRSSRNTRR